MKITKKLVNEFLEYSKNRNLSKDTIWNYKRDLNDFLLFFHRYNHYDVEEITIKFIELYKSSLRKKKINSRSIYYGENKYLCDRTIQWKIQPIKSFLYFMNVVYNIGMNYAYIKVPRADSKHMDYFEVEDLEKIRNAIRKVEKSPINRIRQELLMVLSFTSWMRLSEMLKLKVEDVMKWKTNIVWKNKKERPVYFNEQCKELLSEYLRLRKQPSPCTWKIAKKKCKEDYVFISHNPRSFWKPISKSTVSWHNKLYNEILNIPGKKYTAHTMRHSNATYMLENGINLRDIQQFLWHAHLWTTETYLHIKNKKLEEEHNSLFWNLNI